MKIFSKDFRRDLIPSDTLFLFVFICASVIFFSAAVFGVLGLLFQFLIKNNVYIYMYWISLVLVFLSIVLFIASRFIFQNKLKNAQVHKERGKVSHKKRDVVHFEDSSDLILYDFTIEFSDGSNAVMHMGEDSVRPIRNPDQIVLHDTGTFLYQEWKGEKTFCGFERDDGSNFYKKAYYKHVILPNKQD